MGILTLIVVGFLVGVVARLLKPGPDSLGFLWTTLLGISGALVGGYLGRLLGFYEIGEPAGFITSVIGAVIVLFVVQALNVRSRRAY